MKDADQAAQEVVLSAERIEQERLAGQARQGGDGETGGDGGATTLSVTATEFAFDPSTLSATKLLGVQSPVQPQTR